MKKLLLCCACSLMLCLPFDAFSQDIGLGIKGGTTGVGLDVIGSVSSSFNVRVSGSYFPYSLNGNIDDQDVNIRYEADAEVMTLSAIVDWYPSDSGFHLSGGVFYNGTEVSGVAIPTENYVYGSRTFTPDELGTLSAEAGYESAIAPYLGLGLSKPFKRGKTIGFIARLGVMYAGAPQFDMQGTDMISPTAEQDTDIEAGLQDFKWYPVLDLGISVRIL